MKRLSILLMIILVVISLSAASAADLNHTEDIKAPVSDDNLEIDETTTDLQADEDFNILSNENTNLTSLSDENSADSSSLGDDGTGKLINGNNLASSDMGESSLLGSSEENSILKGDKAPTLNVVGKNTVYYGEKITLQISLTGPDGEKIEVTESNPMHYRLDNILNYGDWNSDRFWEIGNFTFNGNTEFDVRDKLTTKNYTINFSWDGDDVYSAVSQVFNFTVLSPKGTFSELQDLIDHRRWDNVVMSAGVYTYNEEIDGERFRDGILIDGDAYISNAYINGNNSARIFKIMNGANVTLDSCELFNGSADNGGAIYVGENSTVSIMDHSVFSFNNASQNGGAIYIEENSSARIIDSFFEDNHASFSLGDSVYNNGDLSVYNVGVNINYGPSNTCTMYNNGTVSSEVQIIILVSPSVFHDSFTGQDDAEPRMDPPNSEGFEFQMVIVNSEGEHGSQIASSNSIPFYTIDYLNKTKNLEWVWNQTTVDWDIIEYLAVLDSETGMYDASIPYFRHDMLISANASSQNMSMFKNISKSDMTMKAILAGTYTDLQYEIDKANPGDTITLPYDIHYDKEYECDDFNGVNQFPEGIIIDKNITINGNGYAISGSDINRIFKIVNGSTVTLTNIRFVNGNASYGGAIYIDENSTVTIVDSIFENNVASELGSAIYNHNANLSLSGNTVKELCGIYDEGAVTTDVYFEVVRPTGAYKFEEVTLCINVTDGNNIIRSSTGYVEFYFVYPDGNNITLKAVYNETDSLYYVKFTPDVTYSARYNGRFEVDENLNAHYHNAHMYGELEIEINPSVLNVTPVKPVFDYYEYSEFIFNLTTNNGLAIRANETNPIFFYIYNIDAGNNIYINNVCDFNITLDGSAELTFKKQLPEGNYTLYAYWNGDSGSYNWARGECNFTISTEKLVKGTYTDLQYQINTTDISYSLDLKYDFAYNPEFDGDRYPEGVIINKNITINGYGYTISGNNSKRIFKITNESTVHLENIRFVNGSADNGGAIYIDNNSTMGLRYSIFEDNVASSLGSSIYNEGNMSFDSNTVKEPFGIYDAGNITSNVYLKRIGDEYMYVYRFDEVDILFNLTDGNNNGIISKYNNVFDLVYDTGYYSYEQYCVKAIYNKTDGYYHVKFIPNYQGSVAMNYSATYQYSSFSSDTTYISDLYPINATLNITTTSPEFDFGENPVFIINLTGYNNTGIEVNESYPIRLYIINENGEYLRFNLMGFEFSNSDNIYDIYFVGSTQYTLDMAALYGSPEENFYPGKYTARVEWDGIGGYYNSAYVECNFTVGRVKGTYTDLQYLIDHCDDGVLDFEYNFTYSDIYDADRFPYGVIINKTLVINGNGFNISGEDRYRIFNVEPGVEFTISNVTLMNGRADISVPYTYIDEEGRIQYDWSNYHYIYDGGAIYLNGSTLNMNDVIFRDNYANNNGSALYIASGNLNMDDIIFDSNHAASSGAIYAYGTLNVSNCTFINNTANYGGAIYTNGTLNVSNCAFINNTANYGGAIYCYGIYMNNVTFTNNTAEYRGGAVCIDFKSLEVFDGEEEYYSGSYFIRQYQYSLIDFDNVTFVNNTVKSSSGDGSGGGAIYVTFNEYGDWVERMIIDFDNVTFVNNDAYYENEWGSSSGSDGGAVFIDFTQLGTEYALVSFDNVTFANSTAYSLGGAIYIKDDNSPNEPKRNFDVNFNNCTFVNNSAQSYGSIYCEEILNVTNCTFENNTANDVGAIYCYGIYVYNSTFINNTATSNAGAIYVDVHKFKPLETYTYRYDYDEYGWIINSEYIINYYGLINFENATFVNNSARSGSGGAIYISFKNMEEPRESAGIAAVEKIFINFDNVTFVNNSAFYDDYDAEYNSHNVHGGSGGAVYIDFEGIKLNNANLTFDNVNFVNNTAYEDGGAICIKNAYDSYDDNQDRKVTLNNCSFINNSAFYQYVDDWSYYVTSVGNRAGAIYCEGILNLTNCTFENNTANKEGGAIYCYGAYVYNTNFTNNTAGSSGGAIYIEVHNFDHDNMIMEDIQGYTDYYGLISFENVTLINNTAKSENGGAIFITFSNMDAVRSTGSSMEDVHKIYIKFENMTFANNSAFYSYYDEYGYNQISGGEGGAVYIDFNGLKVDKVKVTFDNVTFENNTAYGSGGAVSINAPERGNYYAESSAYFGNVVYKYDVSLNNVSFVNNTAYNSGGAISSQSILNLTNCTFENNTAFSEFGGAVYCYGAHVYNSTFVNNSAYNGAGAIYIDVHQLEEFVDYVHEYYNPNKRWTDPSSDNIIALITFENATFVNNSATKAVGAVFITFSNMVPVAYSEFSVPISEVLINVNNVTFTNNTACNEYAGAFYVDFSGLKVESGSVRFNNVTFENNAAYSEGGAVYIYAPTESGEYSDNYEWNYYESIVHKYDISLTNASFVNNTANGDGGAILINAYENGNYYTNGNHHEIVDNYNVALTNVSFVNNTAQGSGGAIYYAGIMNLTNCTFENNTAYGDYGGAVYCYGAYVYNSTFANNAAENGYGAIYIEVHELEEFDDYYAEQHSWIDDPLGEIIGVITFENVTFVNNTAGKAAGAAFITFGSMNPAASITKVFVNVDNATFANNTAYGEYAGAVYIDFFGLKVESGSLRFNNVTFENNTVANGDGGALYIHAPAESGEYYDSYGNSYSSMAYEYDITLTNASFVNNTAYGSGGAIYCEGILSLINCTFENNTAGVDGGAISINSKNERSEIELTISKETSFVNNTASSGNGGAISIYSEYEESRIDLTMSNDTSFVNNTAGVDGGAISLNANNLYDLMVYLGGEFINNSAGGSGGAVAFYVYSTLEEISVYLDSATFNNNSAGLNGGAVSVQTVENEEDLSVTFESSRFYNNAADGSGGAIYVDSSGDVECWLDIYYSCVFENNTAALNGGAVAVQANNLGDARFNFGKINFSNNSAVGGSGGAVSINAYNSGYVEIELEAVNLTNNTAGVDGGAVSSNAADCDSIKIRLSAVNLTNNIAGVDGGAVFINSSNANSAKLSLRADDETSFENNIAGVNGGAMAVQTDNVNKVEFELYSHVFQNNSATTGSGGAIAINVTGDISNEIGFYIQGNSFENNTAGLNGGAMALQSDVPIDLILGGVSFINNTASVDGGAIYFNSTENSLLNLYNSKFEYNTAFCGGAMYLSNVRGTVSGISFLKNKANSTNITYAHENDDLTLTFSGHENYINAIYAENCDSLSFEDDVIYWNGTVTTVGNAGIINSENETGINITLEIEGIDNPVVLMTDKLGQVHFSTLGLADGEYNFTAYHEDDDYYTPILTKGKFTIKSSSIDTNLTVSVIDIVYGQNATVNVTLTDINGNKLTGVIVNVTIDGQTYEIEINNGFGSRNISGLAAKDKYVVNATFKGNETYNSSNATDNFTVFRANSTVNINVTNVTYDAAVGVNVTVVNATSVTYTLKYANGTIISQNIPITDLKNNLTLTLGAGNYSITVFNAENENFTGSDASANFTVFKAKSLVEIAKIANVTYNATVSVEFNVTNATAVTYVVKTADGRIVVANTTFSDVVSVGNVIALPVLGAGNYTIVIANAENANYTGFVASANFTVYKSSSMVEITAGNVTYPDNVTVSVKVTNATNVTYVIKTADGAVVVANTIWADLNKNITLDLAAGNYTITVANAGNDNITGSVSSANFTVAKANSTLTVNNITFQHKGSNTTTVDYEGATNVTAFIVEIEGADVAIGDKVITVSGLSAGNYTLRVTTVPDTNHTAVTKDVNVTVFKAGSSVDVDVDNATYGGNVEFSVDVVNMTNVSCTVKAADGTVIAENVNETELSEVLNNLAAGNYTVIVFNAENDNFAGSSDSANFTIFKAGSNVTVSVGNVTYNANVVVTVDVVNKTAVTYTVKTVAGAIIVENVEASELPIVLSNLGAGNYTIIVNNADSANITGSSASANFTVFKAGSSVSVDVDNATYGGNVEFSVDVVNMTNVSCTVKAADGTVIAENVNETELSEVLNNLAAGNYTVIVFNADSANFTGSSDSANFTIFKAGSNVTVSVNNVTYDTDVVVTVDVVNRTSVTYTVKSVDGTTVVDNVVASELPIVLSDLGAGNYTITVSNADSANITGSSASANFTVFKAGSNVTVDIDNATYGSDIDFSVGVVNKTTVTYIIKTAEGAVIIDTVNNTEFTDVLGNLSAGNYTVIVSNADNDNFTGSSASDNFTIFRAGSNVTVSVDNVTYGSDVTVNVTVENKTSVTYTVKTADGSTVVENVEAGSLQIVLTNLAAGNYTVVVTNAQNENYTGSCAEANFTVSKASSTVNASDITFTVGESGNTTVTYTGATGVEAVIVDYADVVKVEINVITVSNLEVGNYTMIIATVPDANHTSVSIEVNVTVNPISDYDMMVNSTSPTPGENATVTVQVPENATGNVTVTLENGTNYTGEINNGTATVNIPNLPAGDNNVTVTYPGDDKYAGKTSTATIHVKKVLIDADDMKRGWDSPYDYQARLIYDDGTALANRTLKFVVNGKEYNITTDSNGVAKLTESKLAVGTYNVTVIDPETGANVTKTATIVKRLVENKDLTMDYKDGHKYVVRAIGDDGNPVGANVVVQIKINGVTYKIKTDKNGYARLPINLIPKKYTATSTYHKTTVKNKVTVKQILKIKKTVKVKKGKKIVLKATLKYTNGKALKNKKITFKFKGKKYTAKTNKKGVAKVTIKNKKVLKKLKKGKKYNYSAKYIKDVVKGKVKIR